MRKLCNWLSNRCALSPIFATVLLASIIIIFGSVAYYYSSNLTTTATNNYVNTISNSQQALAERIGFENVVYSSSPATLTICIVNSGSANNLKINLVFIYDASHIIVGAYSGTPNPISTLKSIDGGAAIVGNSLNMGKEGYFTVALSSSLTSGSYSVHLVTQSGGTFDYEFIVP
jgi:hypothetical protein